MNINSVDLEIRVAKWVRTMFGHRILMDRRERAKRVLEEALELAQAEGVPLEHVHKQAQHTYARPLGDPAQEAAGIMFCLVAWGHAAYLNPWILLERELDDAETPERMEEIRRKVGAKNAAGLTDAK